MSRSGRERAQVGTHSQHRPRPPVSCHSRRPPSGCARVRRLPAARRAEHDHGVRSTLLMRKPHSPALRQPSRLGRHTRGAPANRGQWAECDAPLPCRSGRKPEVARPRHPCCRVVPAELAVTDEGPEMPNLPTGPALLRTGSCGRALGRQTVASPQARHLSARRAQNINARVGDTLPEVGGGLKGKAARHCEHRVGNGDCLWIA